MFDLCRACCWPLAMVGVASRAPAGSPPARSRGPDAVLPATPRRTRRIGFSALAFRRGAAGVRLPSRPRGPRGLPDRVVVLHGQPAGGDGRRFGYQLTFFRTGVVRHPRIRPAGRSAICTSPISPCPISATRGFHCFQRVHRTAAWAGRARLPSEYHVWNGDWEARLEDGPSTCWRAREATAIDWRLAATAKPPVLHGERGLSRKGRRRATPRTTTR